MSLPTDALPQMFLTWFAEQYDCGVPDQDIFYVCEAYLQGLLDGLPEHANKANLNQCLSVMRSAGVMQHVLRQYRVTMPSKDQP